MKEKEKKTKILFNLRVPTYDSLEGENKQIKNKVNQANKGSKTRVHFYLNDYGENVRIWIIFNLGIVIK